MHRIGVVSFLNSRPLIDGLAATGKVRIFFDLPARLPDKLRTGEADAALVPIFDVITAGGALRILSDACIGCAAETMTVRVFSKLPPDRIRRLFVDISSHTSVALVQVLWRELFDVELDLVPFDPRTQAGEDHDAVLLIGDKVVDPTRGNFFGFEVDLGAAWRHHTGLPFVFAVWATHADFDGAAELGAMLAAARDRGLVRADAIVDEFAPALGWPLDAARRYLTRCLSYRLTPALVAGANHFAELCARHGLIPAAAALPWPTIRPQTII